MHVYVYACMYTCVYNTYIGECMHVNMYMCAYIYIYIPLPTVYSFTVSKGKPLDKSTIAFSLVLSTTILFPLKKAMCVPGLGIKLNFVLTSPFCVVYVDVSQLMCCCMVDLLIRDSLFSLV